MKLGLCLVVLALFVCVCEGRKCTERELKSHRTWCDKQGNAPPTPTDIDSELKALLDSEQKEEKATEPKSKDGKGLQAFENPKSVDETPKDYKPSEEDAKDKKSPSFLEMRDILNSKTRGRAPIKFAGAGVPANCISQGDLDATMTAIGAPPTTPRASTGVIVASAPYTGSQYHHMFTQFAPQGPAGSRDDGRCYDPGMIVQLPGEPIDVTLTEYEKGCTPFRNVSRTLQTYLECIDPVLATVTGGNWEQAKELYIERIARIAMKSTAANFRQEVINWLDTHGWRSQKSRDKAEFADCAAAAGTHNALMCYPALTHATGSLREGASGGVQSHSSAWLQQGETVKDCRIHPACARLAATEILGFALRPYSKFSFWDSTTPAWTRCRAETGNQNCRLWARCWIKATRGVCAAHPNCCPTQAVRTACAGNNGLSTTACKNICTNP